MAGCKSLKSCNAIKRITKSLDFYQRLDETDYDSLLDYFSKDKYDGYFLDDYHHILNEHLGDHKTVNESNKELERLHEYIMKLIEKCELEKCQQLTRNNRSREKDNLLNNNMINDNDDNDDKQLLEFYVETMDCIHSFLVHIFHIGFRIKSNELKMENESDSELNVDSTMKELQSLIKIKRERLESIRGAERDTNSKFVTKFNDMKHDDNENKEETIQRAKGASSYSFGFRWYYWDYYKDLDENDFSLKYIKPKYKHFDDELLNNSICRLKIEAVKSVNLKAKQKLKSQHIKALQAGGELLYEYGVKVQSKVTEQHLKALILYTDYDSLSYNFTTTFRLLNANESVGDAKKRNSNFAIWSRLLRELVECFGTDICNSKKSKIKTFYHGLGAELIFTSFVAEFAGPTSTSAQICVAAVFAKEKGLIVEIASSDYPVYYFNCSWVSAFPGEDERLYIGGEYPLRFSSIRHIRSGINYKAFIKAISIFNFCMNNGGTNIDKMNCKKKDFVIIKNLINHLDETSKYKNKYSKYINDTFKAICDDKKEISLNHENVDRYYPKMKQLIFNEKSQLLPQIFEFLKIFKNCNQVYINYEFFYAQLESSYFDLLLQELININKNLKRDDVKMRIEWVNCNNLLNEYIKKYKESGWKIKVVEQGAVGDTLEIFKYNNINDTDDENDNYVQSKESEKKVFPEMQSESIIEESDEYKRSYLEIKNKFVMIANYWMRDINIRNIKDVDKERMIENVCLFCIKIHRLHSKPLNLCDGRLDNLNEPRLCVEIPITLEIGQRIVINLERLPTDKVPFEVAIFFNAEKGDKKWGTTNEYYLCDLRSSRHRFKNMILQNNKFNENWFKVIRVKPFNENDENPLDKYLKLESVHEIKENGWNWILNGDDYSLHNKTIGHCPFGNLPYELDQGYSFKMRNNQKIKDIKYIRMWLTDVTVIVNNIFIIDNPKITA